MGKLGKIILFIFLFYLSSLALDKEVDVYKAGMCSEDIQLKLVERIKIFQQLGEYVIAIENCGDIVGIFAENQTRRYIRFSYSSKHGKCEISYFYINDDAIIGFGRAELILYVVEKPGEPAVKCRVSIDEPFSSREKAGERLRLVIY